MKRVDWIQKELAKLKEKGLYSNIRTLSSAQGAWVVVDGKKVLNFCSNNYLGLANHPKLIAAAKSAIDTYGVGPGAVRTIAGTMDLHTELEKRIAAFKGVESAITFQSGFTANTGTIQALVGKNDIIFSDALNHASIIDGVRLCKAKRFRYANNDMADLERCLKEAAHCRFRLIATDGVFSMDGIIANLAEICALADKYDAMVMVDDSHAVGFMGPGGRGMLTPSFSSASQVA